MKAAAELTIDKHVMRFKGQASQTKLGFKQVFELYHSLPQVQMKFSSIDVTCNNKCCVRDKPVGRKENCSTKHLHEIDLEMFFFLSLSHKGKLLQSLNSSVL